MKASVTSYVFVMIPLVILGIALFAFAPDFDYKPLLSEQLDSLCNENNSVLYRNETTWGCVQLNESAFT